MTYVITSKCMDELYAQCVDVCPVDCIYPGQYEKKSYMVIDPKLCINCDACLQMCPIGAIVDNEKKDVEAGQLNARLAPLFKGNPDVVRRNPKSKPNRSDNALIY